MTPAAVFDLAGTIAIAGWVALLVSLIVAPARRYVWPATQLAIPAILAVTYVLLIFGGREAFESGGFGSITEVRALFANDSALAAGWLHYLAFDLFVGTWIVRDGLSRGIHSLIVLPCLPLTFLFGPAGLLLYFVLRFTFGRAPADTEPTS
jgi:ABA4-like protein